MKPLADYFEIMACVARADGRIAPEEQKSLAEAIASSGLDTGSVARVNAILDLTREVDTREIVARVAKTLPVAALVEVLRDAYVVALLDGELDPREVAFLESLLEEVGVPERRRAAIHTWAETAARQHLDGMELIHSARPTGQGHSTSSDVAQG